MFNWILSSTILIIVVILLRALFKGKISLTLQYALWGLVLLRLLIPLNIGSTVISAVNLIETAKQQPVIQTVVDMVNVNIPQHSYEEAYKEVLEQYESQGIHIGSLQKEEQEAFEQEVQTLMEGDTVAEILADILFVLWIAGIAVVAGMFLYTNIRFGARLKASRIESGVHKEKLTVYVSGALETPCLFGVLKPAVYVTAAVADDPTLLRHTVEHEWTHYRHGDHVWSVLRGLCVAIHWYNPLVWCAAFLSQRDAELACDEATIKRLGESERAEYGRTLIAMTCSRKPNVLTTATTMTESKKGIKERVLLIAKKPKMAIYALVAVLVVVAIAVGCTFTGAKEDSAEEVPTDEQLAEFFTSYSGEGRPDGAFSAYYIGSTDEYALVFYKGTGAELILYHYAFADGQINVLSATDGEYKLSKGITMNHLATEKGHLYFGTVSDIRGIWETLVLMGEDGNEVFCSIQGKAGFICELETPLADFRVLNQRGTVATNMTEYLKRFTVKEADFDKPDMSQTVPTETTVPDETTEPTEAVRTWPYDDAIGSDSEYPSVLTVEDISGPLFQSKIKNKICIGVYLTKLGERPAYIIPENQADFLEVFKQAYLNGEKEEGARYSNMRGWSIHYQGDDWYIMDDGSVWNLMDNEVLPAEIAADLVLLCENAVSSVGVPEPLRPENITQLRSATLQWQGTHTVTNAETLRILESILRNAKDCGGATSCPFGIYLTLEFTNGETKTVTVASDSCAVWMSEGKYYAYNEDYDSPWPRSKPLYEIFAPGIIYQTIRTDLSAMDTDTLMNTMMYINWDRYSECYGYEETMYLMRRFRAWIMEKPEERYGSALYCIDGLNDAYAESYAAMLSELFEIDKAGFAWACLGNAPEAIEAQVLTCLAEYWDLSVNETERILREAINTT